MSINRFHDRSYANVARMGNINYVENQTDTNQSHSGHTNVNYSYNGNEISIMLTTFLNEFKSTINPLISLLTKVIEKLLPK